VSSLAFSPDGKVLASGSGDTTILIWDVRDLSGAKPKLVERSEKELEQHWEGLSDGNAAPAGALMRELAETGGTVVPFLQSRLERLPGGGLTAAKIEQYIQDLNDASFEVRSNATKELGAGGKGTLAAVQKTLADKPSLEMRRRLEQIEQKLTERLGAATVSAEDLRALRAVQILERIGTREAAKALEQLARRAEDDPLGDDARAALKRLRPDIPVPQPPTPESRLPSLYSQAGTPQPNPKRIRPADRPDENRPSRNRVGVNSAFSFRARSVDVGPPEAGCGCRLIQTPRRAGGWVRTT
jgi:hypothetical protein